MEGKKIAKIAVSLLTVGVTITVGYYTIKGVKKYLAKRKNNKEAAEKELKEAESKKEAKTT